MAANRLNSATNITGQFFVGKNKKNKANPKASQSNKAPKTEDRDLGWELSVDRTSPSFQAYADDIASSLDKLEKDNAKYITPNSLKIDAHGIVKSR